MKSLVLIPGMMCDARLYTPQIEALSCYGSLYIPALYQESTIEAMAHKVLSGAPTKFALAGLSMGGIVAMEVMRLAPHRVTKLALMDTNPLAESTEVSIKRQQHKNDVTTKGLPRVIAEDIAPYYFAHSDAIDKGIFDTCVSMANDLGVDVFMRQNKALESRFDQQATLAAVKAPTLIVSGQFDRVCPPSRHALMHNLIEGSKWVSIDNAGHLPTLENPKQSNQVLKSWFLS